MFFGVFDFTFVWWIIIGAATVLVTMGANEWFKDLNIPMTWWKWVVLSAWYVFFWLGIAAPFTFMGENEVAAGWRLMAFSLPFLIISGIIVYRILIIGKQTLKS
jgi:hypothetical protein